MSVSFVHVRRLPLSVKYEEGSVFKPQPVSLSVSLKQAVMAESWQTHRPLVLIQISPARVLVGQRSGVESLCV